MCCACCGRYATECLFNLSLCLLRSRSKQYRRKSPRADGGSCRKTVTRRAALNPPRCEQPPPPSTHLHRMLRHPQSYPVVAPGVFVKGPHTHNAKCIYTMSCIYIQHPLRVIARHCYHNQFLVICRHTLTLFGSAQCYGGCKDFPTVEQVGAPSSVLSERAPPRARAFMCRRKPDILVFKLSQCQLFQTGSILSPT